MKMVHRGEVYWADLQGAMGCEQKGNRPVLILQNDVGNYFSQTTIVATMTHFQRDKRFPTHVAIESVHDSCTYEATTVQLEQLRTIDKHRLGRYICTLSKNEMRMIDRALRLSLQLV